MVRTKLNEMAEYGQSLWLDYISRSMIESGKLKDMISEGVMGMTSNPSIFNQAISDSEDYDSRIIDLKEQGKTTFEIYDDLTIEDIKDAADAFKPVYDATNKLDGYVSLEINPQIANEVDAQIKEGIRLFQKVGKPNVMIKVPSTVAGYKVIEALIAQGINVNATLIFSLFQYQEVADAYIRGLMQLSDNGGDLGSVHSVASVFVSRIDTAVDKKLQEMGTDQAKALLGKAAVSNSCLVFDKFRDIFSSDCFKDLQEKGANVQRVLWASTGTKNPEYSDVKYIEELISRPTVNTVPEKTLNAFIDHGSVQEASMDIEVHKKNISDLNGLGIDINNVCSELLDAGVTAFAKAFDSLFEAIEQKASRLIEK